MRSLTPNMGDLVQREHPKIGVESGWGQEHIKAVITPKRCNIIGPKLLLYGLIYEVTYALSIATNISDLG